MINLAMTLFEAELLAQEGSTPLTCSGMFSVVAVLVVVAGDSVASLKISSEEAHLAAVRNKEAPIFGCQSKFHSNKRPLA